MKLHEVVTWPRWILVSSRAAKGLARWWGRCMSDHFARSDLPSNWPFHPSENCSSTALNSSSQPYSWVTKGQLGWRLESGCSTISVHLLICKKYLAPDHTSKAAQNANAMPVWSYHKWGTHSSTHGASHISSMENFGSQSEHFCGSFGCSVSCYRTILIDISKTDCIWGWRFSFLKTQKMDSFGMWQIELKTF